METYQDKLDNDNDISYREVNIGRRKYVLVMDGQYTWATPLKEWVKVVAMEAETIGEDNDWYSPFCQQLSYDSEFCLKHEAEFAGAMPFGADTKLNWA